MAMVLALLCISLVLTVVTAVLIAALCSADSPPALRKNPQPRVTSRFFQPDIAVSVPGVPASAVPVEALLLEIERHVRLERAAAESFHLAPTPQALHVHTASQLMH